MITADGSFRRLFPANVTHTAFPVSLAEGVQAVPSAALLPPIPMGKGSVASIVFVNSQGAADREWELWGAKKLVNPQDSLDTSTLMIAWKLGKYMACTSGTAAGPTTSSLVLSTEFLAKTFTFTAAAVGGPTHYGPLTDFEANIGEGSNCRYIPNLAASVALHTIPSLGRMTQLYLLPTGGTSALGNALVAVD